MEATLERLRARRDERGDEGGFTLIELLIVIVILAILAAIVVFAVQNLTSSSAKASCESDVQTTDHAVQAFFAQVGKYPNSIAELEAASGVTLADGTTNTGPWLHNTPKNGTNYDIVLADEVTTSGSPATYSPGAVAVAGTTTTATNAQVQVLGKWNGTNWGTNTAYTPPANGPADACAAL